MKNCAEQATVRLQDSSKSMHRRDSRILVVDSDQLSLRKSRTSFSTAGYKKVTVFDTLAKATRFYEKEPPDLIFLDVSLGDEREARFAFLFSICKQPFHGIVAVMSEWATADICYRAARLGADDFLLKGPYLRFADEADRLLQREGRDDHATWYPDVVSNVGLFTSAGLTKSEITVLRAFACGFPRHRVIAERLELTNATVQKTFSRIYEKLGIFIQMDNAAQLSHFLTICSLYGLAQGAGRGVERKASALHSHPRRVLSD